MKSFSTLSIREDPQFACQGDLCVFLYRYCFNSGVYINILFPNLLNYSSQEATMAEAAQYVALSEIPCSPYMEQFVCAMLFPQCGIVNSPTVQNW